MSYCLSLLVLLYNGSSAPINSAGIYYNCAKPDESRCVHVWVLERHGEPELTYRTIIL